MKGFKKCDNNHFYKDNLSACPHCPGGASANHNPSGGFDRTVVEGTAHNVDSTVFEGDLGKTQVMGGSTGGIEMPVASEVIDLSKTHIVSESNTGGDSTEEQIVRRKRKLVGWLISYTVDEMGRDYRIFEGRNTIGTAPVNDIVISSDPSVSGHHTTILFRANKYYVTDELSSNGTKLNDEDLEPRAALILEDGSSITVGETIFKFRSSL